MPTNPLAELMADTAREMREHKPEESLLDEALAATVRDVGACQAAALSVVRRKQRVETCAATSDEARRSDELQYETGEGPCLEAIWEQRTVHSPDLRDDPRWPTWGVRMSDEVGFRSMASFQLFTDSENLGALSLYSRQRRAFAPADIEHAEALAAHLAVAMAAALIIDGMEQAVLSRTDIGIAQGIVMERYSVDRSQAFAPLTRLSSHSNRKLRDIAAEIAGGSSVADVSRPTT